MVMSESCTEHAVPCSYFPAARFIYVMVNKIGIDLTIWYVHEVVSFCQSVAHKKEKNLRTKQWKRKNSQIYKLRKHC